VRRARVRRCRLGALLGAAAFCSLIAAAFWTNVSSVLACSIPVFRYALEHWPVEPYGVIVFHRGELGEDHRGIVDRLDEFAPVEVATVALSGQVEERRRAIYEAAQVEEGPCMVACYPRAVTRRGIVWSRPLGAASVRALLDSPVRREIAGRILKGDSVVWVLLESGNREQDEAAAGLLADQLGRLGESLELPEPVAGALGALSEDLPELRVAFSMLRLSRTDPSEEALVSMLVQSEWDLTTEKYAAQPMAFPVFGRGRVLCALVGKGINEKNIGRISRFLTGPCSCAVQASSPGTQLLISVDWESLTAGTPVVGDVLPLPGLSAFAPPAEAAPGTATADAPPAERPGALRRNVLIVALFGVAFAAAGTFVLKRARK